MDKPMPNPLGKPAHQQTGRLGREVSSSTRFKQTVRQYSWTSNSDFNHPNARGDSACLPSCARKTSMSVHKNSTRDIRKDQSWHLNTERRLGYPSSRCQTEFQRRFPIQEARTISLYIDLGMRTLHQPVPNYDALTIYLRKDDR